MITWGSFRLFVLDQLGYGLYFVIMTAPGALASAIVIRALELDTNPPVPMRITGGIVCAIATGCCMLIAAGTINMALPGWIVSIALGALAGAWAMPRPRASLAAT
jgi:hypothetical protein